MQALNAGLAFALTMLILATVVSTLVETVHRLFGLRESGLRILLGHLYDRVLASRTVTAAVDDARSRFIDMMTVNRGPVGATVLPFLNRGLDHDAQSEDRRFLNWIWGGRRLGSLSLNAFMERLGGSEFGAALVTQVGHAGEAGVESVLQDVAQKFEAFGVEASGYFEARARLVSVFVGFAVAFALNVNAFTLFETYMKRPDVTEAVLAKQDAIKQQYETIAAQTKTLDAAVNAGVTTLEPDQQKAVEQIKQASAAAHAAVTDLQQVGVPIGWDSVAQFRSNWVRAIPGLLLGGMLIGLGAPFWYRMAQNLTAIRSVTKPKDTEPAAAAAPAGTGDPKGLPSTPIEVFHVALGAALTAGELAAPEEAVG